MTKKTRKTAEPKLAVVLESGIIRRFRQDIQITPVALKYVDDC